MEPIPAFSRISSHERGGDMAGSTERSTKAHAYQWFVVPSDVSAGDSRVFFSEQS